MNVARESPGTAGRGISERRVTFFMIVTDRDAVIANHAIRSFSKIRDVPFTLLVYSNWLSSDLKTRYFPQWRACSFVQIIENGWQTDDNKPTDRSLWGPFELGATIWNRELRRIKTPYIATVDADFEVLDGRFVQEMVSRLDADPTIGVIATDYSPDNPASFDPYSNDIIRLNERWHTWCCMYRRVLLEAPVSHAYHEESIDGPVRRNAWDDAAYLQKYIKEVLGYRLEALDPAYQKCFIHYGAFGHNKDINERNVSRYRRLKILRKVGLLGPADFATRSIAGILYLALFGHVDRSKYLDGWAQPSSAARTQ